MWVCVCGYCVPFAVYVTLAEQRGFLGGLSTSNFSGKSWDEHLVFIVGVCVCFGEFVKCERIEEKYCSAVLGLYIVGLFALWVCQVTEPQSY